jgi:hypothetical protein
MMISRKLYLKNWDWFRYYKLHIRKNSTWCVLKLKLYLEFDSWMFKTYWKTVIRLSYFPCIDFVQLQFRVIWRLTLISSLVAVFAAVIFNKKLYISSATTKDICVNSLYCFVRESTYQCNCKYRIIRFNAKSSKNL